MSNMCVCVCVCVIAGCTPLAERQLTVGLVGGVKGVALLGIHYSQGYFDVGPLKGVSNA